MAKKLTLTESLRAAIRKAAGDDDIDFNLISAYEAVAASTRPISQSATAYDGAMMTETFLRDMETYLETESVPIHVMHNGSVLPIGKTFKAGVLEAEAGHYDLNALFYVESDSEHARQIDLGIIDEVSVGALPKHAYCSECDFDYMAPENEYSFYYRECDEGHALGQNGVHLRLTGLEKWKELSLVGKGASNKPKILGTAKQRLSKESYEQLAASGMSPEAVQMSYLLCSATPKTKDEGAIMDLMELSNKAISLSAEKAKLESKLESVEANLATSDSKVAELNGKVTELQTQLAATDESAIKLELTEAKAKQAEFEPVTAYLTEQVKIAAVAAGLELKEDATMQEQIEVLKSAQIKLGAIPRNGSDILASGGKEQTAELSATILRNSAFLTK